MLKVKGTAETELELKGEIKYKKVILTDALNVQNVFFFFTMVT